MDVREEWGKKTKTLLVTWILSSSSPATQEKYNDINFFVGKRLQGSLSPRLENLYIDAISNYKKSV